MPDPSRRRPSQRELLRRHGIRPVRRRGQNFLLDGNLARAVAADVLALGRDVLELGAGAGALTGPLLDGGARVTAVEVDRRLCAVLREEFGGEPDFRLLEADLATLDWDAALAAAGERPVVAGNLPYVLTSEVLFALAGRAPRLAGAVCMVQREVADRLTAPPGHRDHGILAVLLGSRFTVERRHAVPPDVFWPRPDVQSAVVRLLPREETWNPAAWERFRRMVRALFGQRRKALGGLLRSVGGLDAAAAAALLERTGLDPRLRPQHLDGEQWRRLLEAWPEDGAWT